VIELHKAKAPAPTVTISISKEIPDHATLPVSLALQQADAHALARALISSLPQAALFELATLLYNHQYDHGVPR
tara:strand:- start:2575 stop:2796 length:222 start_codon:yes stop_codon:yes gene_type:complete